jgi:hypothetical protein
MRDTDLGQKAVTSASAVTAEAWHGTELLYGVVNGVGVCPTPLDSTPLATLSTMDLVFSSNEILLVDIVLH